MKILFAAACLAAVSPALRAAPAADPGPVDPAAAGSRVEYRSVFGVPAGVEQEAVPWKKANADVGQFPRGHIDLLKWEQGQAGAARPAAAPATAPAAPPAPQPAGSGHHMH